MSFDSRFDNETLNKFEEETFILNKDVEESASKIL